MILLSGEMTVASSHFFASKSQSKVVVLEWGWGVGGREAGRSKNEQWTEGWEDSFGWVRLSLFRIG